MNKKHVFGLLMLCMVLSLSACGYRTVEEMYRIPKRTQEFTLLQSTIEQTMSGLEFASPTTGDNQQTVQTADIDGDGRPEYLVFARGNSEKPLKLLIFHETEDNQYFLMEKLEMNGSAFEQVEYAQMDDHPGVELILGRRLGDQMMRIAAVYSFSEGQSNQLVNTIYTKLLVTDLDENGQQELMVIREGDTDISVGSAVVYYYQGGAMERSREIRLSQRVEQLKRCKVSKLESGEPAVYLSSTMNDSAIVTDVLMFKDGSLQNLNSTGKLAYSIQALRNYFLYMSDIDEDGIMELPSLIDMQPIDPEERSPEQLVYWYAIDSDGEQTPKMYTFHNVDGGWYVFLDMEQERAERISVQRQGNGIHFYIWDEAYEETKLLFTIYAYTGKDRNQMAQKNNQFLLHQGDNVVYAGKLEVSSAIHGINQESVRQSFHLISADWKKEG